MLMSGGVDSTVAAFLLRSAGYEVEGLTFWLWSFPGAPDYHGRTKCCSLDSAALAAQELGIPHRTIDASDAFYEEVVRDFVARYRRGETPNPCGRCNRHLRFPSRFATRMTTGSTSLPPGITRGSCTGKTDPRSSTAGSSWRRISLTSSTA